MTNYARVINNTAVDVSTDPTNQFHPDIAAQFEPVPDDVKQGWVRIDGVWSAPAPTPQPEPMPTYPKVSPVEFLLLFTSAERVAIRAVRPDDPVIDDFFDLVEDTRFAYVDLGLPSVQGALHYLAASQLITDARREEILTGKVQ